MRSPLPKSNFKWVQNPQKIDIAGYDRKSNISYILEVDLFILVIYLKGIKISLWVGYYTQIENVNIVNY